MSTALITGANRGIGLEVARTLASEGWHVLSGVRNPKSAPPQTQAEIIDMEYPESIAALAERLRARNQRLDALVNNAGVNGGDARHIWAVNVLGPLRLTRALQSLLLPNARVVMVSSGMGLRSAQPRSLVKRLSNPELSLRDLEQLADSVFQKNRKLPNRRIVAASHRRESNTAAFATAHMVLPGESAPCLAAMCVNQGVI